MLLSRRRWRRCRRRLQQKQNDAPAASELDLRRRLVFIGGVVFTGGVAVVCAVAGFGVAVHQKASSLG